MFIDVAPNSSGNRFRSRRISWFLDLLTKIQLRGTELRIIDVGGTMDHWNPHLASLERFPVKLTLLNLQSIRVNDSRFESIEGDARDLARFPDDAFDVVYSNSVIEHVGRWPDMAAMAREIRRVAPSHFVQTPYFWFPIEPHCRTPFFHWLPEPWQLRMIMSKRRGFWEKANDVNAGMLAVQSAVLLDKRMFQGLFPDSRIVSEKLLLMTKSLVAVRTHRGSQQPSP